MVRSTSAATLPYIGQRRDDTILVIRVEWLKSLVEALEAELAVCNDEDFARVGKHGVVPRALLRPQLIIRFMSPALLHSQVGESVEKLARSLAADILEAWNLSHERPDLLNMLIIGLVHDDFEFLTADGGDQRLLVVR